MCHGSPGHEPKGAKPGRPAGPARPNNIEALLERDPICQEIVAYLSRHTEAVDTARGIADWWIKRDPRRTEEALVKLLRRGVVRSVAVHGTTSMYGYTKDLRLRQRLRRYLETRVAPKASRRA
jgi:hypothetical protein